PTGGSGSAGGGRGGASGGAAGPAGSGAVSGDTTGVTDGKIVVGVHAPLTGAAPLRQESFNAGKDLFWKYGNGGKPVTVFGRKVEVIFRDDQYNPSHARLVCQEMAERGNAFLLIGGGGTDQIQACAQYAASKQIPYLSAGVTEAGLRQLPNYFAASKSYPQQATMLATYIKKHLGVTDASRVAAVITNTPNFDDTVQAFARAFPGVRIFRPDKNERGSSMAGNLCTGTVKNFDVVFPLAAPTYYLEMASAAACRPLYAGVGISMGLDQVASTGCEANGATANARFFSPAPSFEDVRRGKWDPNFVRAARAAGVEPDDVMWLFWGQSRVLYELLVKAGRNLNREGFIASTSQASVRTGVYPDLRYTPSDHFGAQHVHVLRNVCRPRGDQSGYYITEGAFVSRF
ncbi:MAG: ABC transporter substrate-binding protein, partial [Carbonactinosporaceae bacterium]